MSESYVVKVADVKTLKSTQLPDGSVLHITKERRNELVKRLEIEGIVVHIGKGTPKRADVLQAVAKLYGKPEDLIVVKKILSEYGVGVTRVKVFMYDSMERLIAFEPKYVLKRHGR